MTFRIPGRRGLPLLAFMAAMLPHAAGAQDRIDEAVDTSERTTAASARSQRRIDNLDDETKRKLEAYRQAIWKRQQLEVYSRQLAELQTLQAQEKAELEAELTEVPLSEDDLMPLMLRMVDALDRFIQADLPFLQDERMQRITSLKQMLGNAEAGLSEKFRRVIEAYQIELDYGRGLASERTELEVNNRRVVVDTLRVGRVSLYFLSLDGETAAMWDSQAGAWQPLPATERGSVRQAIRIAREVAAPELLTLPVPAPTPAGDDS